MPADFSFIHTKPFSVKMSSEEPGTMTFMAPELLPPTRFGLEKEVPSKEASIHALSMTVVLAGQWPFYPKKEVEIMCTMICGERPPEPENAEEIWITKAVWDLLRDYWRSVRILQCRTDTARRMFVPVRRSSCVDRSDITTTESRKPLTGGNGLQGNTYYDLPKEHYTAPGSPKPVKQYCFPPWNTTKGIFEPGNQDGVASFRQTCTMIIF